MSGAPELSKEMKQSFKKGDIPIEGAKSKEDDQPLYQMVGDSRIPVSKHLGKMWKSRVDAAQARRNALSIGEAWDQAIKYYKNDQLEHRSDGDPDHKQNVQDEVSDQFSETENIVFANTSALVPAIYSKNPVVEFTAEIPEMKPLGTRLERLVNKLFGMESAPGINLKPKARKAVVLATLTNNAWAEIGWTQREDSSAEAYDEMLTLSDEYKEAKDSKTIKEIEGKIMALESKIDVLRPAGPFLRIRKPHDILLDPACEMSDGSDGNWMIDYDYINTDFLRAMYTKEGEQGERVSIFQPTHVMKLQKAGKSATDGLDEEVAQFSLLNEAGDTGAYRSYGFEDADAFKKAQMTRVARVWDKVTRRVLLFNANDWSWPIWVWDDPYQLPNFFPFRALQFYVDPVGDETKGEVVYYLDQQDAINEINSERHLARQWARKNYYFDKNRINADDVTALMRGYKQGGVGVDVPEGAKIDDFIKVFVPPSVNFQQLLDKQPHLDAIDRISSVQGVMRGAQFKTNTTNDAVNKYDAVSQTRLDEKVDAIEDFFGNIARDICFLCLRFMPEDMVNQLIGVDPEVPWQNMPAKEAAKIDMTVVGGSTRKPSGAAKKEEAIQIGQVLGQFVRASPVALVVALKMMEEAFDTITIKEEDWQQIRQSVESQLQGQSEGGGADLVKMFDQLPPEAKKAFGDATAKGAPAEQVLQAIMQKLQGAEQPQQPEGQPPQGEL